jgi:hypothetical protein
MMNPSEEKGRSPSAIFPLRNPHLPSNGRNGLYSSIMNR